MNRQVSQRSPSSAADERARLETEKLQAEIVEIRAPIDDIKAWWSRWHKAVALLVAVVTLAAGGCGLFKQAQAFLEERARRFDIQLDAKMIELSFQLDSPEPKEASSAAVLLSAYEDHAVPILVDHLRDANPKLKDDLIESLERIMGKKRIRKDPDKVLSPLLRQTSLVFREETRDPWPSSKEMSNYLDAIERVARGLAHPATLKTLSELEAMIATEDSSLRGDDRDAIQGKIGKVRTAVSSARNR